MKRLRDNDLRVGLKSSKYYRPTKRARSTYQTVARTRGPYGQGEMKYSDLFMNQNSGADDFKAIPASTDWTGTEMDDEAVLQCVTIPAPGTGINNRIGVKCNIHKIAIRGFIKCAKQTNQTGGKDPALIRMVLVLDTQTNGVQAQGEDVMDNDIGGSGTSIFSVVNAFQNPKNFGRFRVLKDKTINLSDPNDTYDGTNIEINGIIRPFKMTVKFKKPLISKVQAGSTTSAISNMINYSFHLYASTQSADLAPAISYVSRVYFKD